jgi:hypothetical protein
MRFDRRWIRDAPATGDALEAAMVAFGAPATCRVVRLFAPGESDAAFEPGSRVPLRAALEIASGLREQADQILVCLPGRLGYVATHEQWDFIAYRPS